MLTIDDGYLGFDKLTMRKFIKKFKDIAGINTVKDLSEENINKAINEVKDERDFALVNRIIIMMQTMNTTDVIKIRDRIVNDINDLLDEFMEFHFQSRLIDSYVSNMFPFVSTILIDKAIKDHYDKSTSELNDKDLGKYKDLNEMLYDLNDCVKSNQQDYDSYKNEILYYLRDNVFVNNPSTDYLDIYFEGDICTSIEDAIDHICFRNKILNRMKNKIKRATTNKQRKKISKADRESGILNVFKKVRNNELEQDENNS